jgi:hypothetical protein
MAVDRVRGVGLRGDEPKRLALSDGSRLLLDCESTADPLVTWKRVGRHRPHERREISVPEARELAGEDYATYVATRTRAEAEWMRAVADWYRDQADQLESQLP